MIMTLGRDRFVFVLSTFWFKFFTEETHFFSCSDKILTIFFLYLKYPHGRQAKPQINDDARLVLEGLAQHPTATILHLRV